VNAARSLRRWGLLALPLLGALELGLHLGFARRPPPIDGGWAPVEAPVRAMKREGELVVIAPGWADPLARQALGDELMPLRDVARPDVTRYASALEVSILGASAPETEGWREVERRDEGKFRIRRLENPAPARVIYDFTDNLRPPAVDVRGTQPAITCGWNPTARVTAGGLGGHPTFPRERFECPGGEFFNVSVTVIADERFEPRRCIWSHPLGRGEIVTRYRGVPLGERIRGHHGMYWIIERELKGAPVTITVRVDGETIGSAVHRDGDGWAGFDLPLGAHAGKPAAEVEFAVTSPSNAHRHYCFEADTR
jgi:hypothetical protein